MSLLRISVVADLGQPLDQLLVRLMPAERQQAERSWPEGRRRQFALGRLAAHLAVRRVLADRASRAPIEVLGGPNGEPLARVDGGEGIVSVSLAHSGRLALACAWPGARRHIGVDLERVRPTDVARSHYAFSRRERALLARAPEGLALAGLAAWTAKEAAWKAMGPFQPTSPAGIELGALSLIRGRAVAETPPGHLRLEARLGLVAGPDGPYILSIAQLTQYTIRNPFAGDINHESPKPRRQAAGGRHRPGRRHPHWRDPRRVPRLAAGWPVGHHPLETDGRTLPVQDRRRPERL